MMLINNCVDIVLGLQNGGEGKSKIATGLSSRIDYELTASRTNELPSVIAYKKEAYIGPGTHINFSRLEKEIQVFKKKEGFDPLDFLYISPQAVVVSDACTGSQDKKTSLASSYSFPSDKGRETIEDPDDTDSLLVKITQRDFGRTASSKCHPGIAAAQFGFDTKKIRNIIGVAKCYETRPKASQDLNTVLDTSGAPTKPVECPGNTYWIEQTCNQIQSIAEGPNSTKNKATRFLDLTALCRSIEFTGVNILIINGWDVLAQLPREAHFPFDCAYSYYLNGHLVKGDLNMKFNVKKILRDAFPSLTIIYSDSPVNNINWCDYSHCFQQNW